MGIRFPSMTTSFFVVFILLLTCTLYADGCYTSIISFGDSLADTGNGKLLTFYEDVELPQFMFAPYGETYFHESTGRCSNGRLIIDFVAESLGLPFIPPFWGGARNDSDGGVMDFGHGVNYAVVGSIAMDSLVLEARGRVQNPSIVSLGVQFEWFKQHLPSICGTSLDCRQFIRSSLILMGEIGGNDYYHALAAGKSIDDLKSYVPLVISSVITTINGLIELGAETLVVPGNLPIGCSPVYLTMYSGPNVEEYDNTTGCLIRLNKFAEYHNELLQRELNQIRERYPDVNIMYGDYYNAAMQFYQSPKKFGFQHGSLKACCGGGGPFNYNASAPCGSSSSTTCAEPNMYANWDGLHLTETSYRLLYKSLFEGSYTIPPFNSLCRTILQATSGSSEFA